METLRFEYNGNHIIINKSHVGVVGSGDLEIMMTPSNSDISIVNITTRFEGFNQIWERILTRFFEENPVQATIRINDFGATPGMVALRLRQGLEVARNA